jgi:hypothetical protein
MKLENLLFTNNREFFATSLIGIGILEHRELDLAFHLDHRMLVYGIEHLELNVIF